MEIKEAMEILEKDIHTEVPKAAISARKHDAAVRMALVALEKQIPVKPIILDQLNGDIDYECPMCGKQVMSDADEFQKQIVGMAILNNYPPNKANALCKLVDSQPTAFDVEEVVRELRDLKMRYYLTIANTGDADKDCAYLNAANAIDRAIEIVKRGGINGEK